eukprot:6198705-Pleurochrysis_carterae.AAC.2
MTCVKVSYSSVIFSVYMLRPRGSNARGAPCTHEKLLVQILREELLVCTTSSSIGKPGRGALRLREELLVQHYQFLNSSRARRAPRTYDELLVHG